MKKHFMFIILLVSVIASSSASIISDFAPDFGRFYQDEDLVRYEKDTTAEAVYLRDKGNAYFGHVENGFEIVFQHTQRIKILKKAGMNFASFEIPYYIDGNRAEEISDIAGFTYNQIGKRYEKTPLDIKTVYEEDYTSHWKVKKFTMPNVREGSVVEIIYSITSPYFFNFRNWDFQKKVPVIYSEYVVRMIPFYSYNYILQGRTRCDEFRTETDNYERSFYNAKFNDQVYTFVMKDIPAYKDEAFINCPDDYMIKLNFQLSETIDLNAVRHPVIETWNKLVNELLDSPEIGGYLKKAKSSADKLVQTMGLADKTPLEKIRAIDQYMKFGFSWDKHQSKYTDKSLKQFLESKTGNSAEINLFYVAMLKAAGVDAYPVILSTRDNGKIKADYPFAHFFNYLIAAASVEGKILVFDATEPLISMSSLPERCINDNGLALKKTKLKDPVEWVQLNSTKKSLITYLIDLNLDLKVDSVNANVNMVSNGYFATKFRNDYISDPDDFKKSIVPDNYALWDSIQVKNVQETDKSLSFRYLAKTHINVFNDKIFIDPFCTFVESVNPLRQPTRTCPIDLTYKQAKEFQTVIHVPEGYAVIRKPSEINMEKEDFTIRLSTELLDASTLKIAGGYEFKKEVYPVDRYNDMKEYFRLITTMFNDEVILQRIQPESQATATL